jgi:hypothetical protein
MPAASPGGTRVTMATAYVNILYEFTLDVLDSLFHADVPRRVGVGDAVYVYQ